MSVVGFDFGNDSCVVAIARQRRIDIILNDISERETPTIVCFGKKRRFVGVDGADESKRSNPKNIISQIKRLIGRPFSDPELQHDLKALPFTISEGPDGFPLIHTEYLGEMRTFGPTQVLAMVFSDLKRIADKNSEVPIIEGTINLKAYFGDSCCIGIPAYFTELQRRAILDAAKIAGLRPLRLLHETTATALAYGLYKINLPENDQLNVVFVDIGHASMQVCVAGFKKGELKILAYSFDRSLGGRDFDEALFHHFAEKFKEEYEIDVYPNAKACIRLRGACEDLKKTLLGESVIPLDIEFLMCKKISEVFIKRDEFEKISAPILDRVRKPLEKALSEAGLKVENIHSVEVVGSGSRVPAISKILTEFFGKQPRRRMASCQSVAQGCALECATLNPSFKLPDFKVYDIWPFSIAFSWRSSTQDAQSESSSEDQHSTIVFPKGTHIPNIKELTFYKSEAFEIDIHYADPIELHKLTKISTYKIGPIRKTRSPRTRLIVAARLSFNGIVLVDSATLLEEAEVEVPGMGDTNATGTGESSTGAAEPNAKASKKKVKKWDIPVLEIIYNGKSTEDLEKAMDMELEMAMQDRLMEDTRDSKNDLLAYVYTTTDKLKNEFWGSVTELEKNELTAKLEEAENWLYKNGEDETKGVYVAKYEELKKLVDTIEEHSRTYDERTLESSN